MLKVYVWGLAVSLNSYAMRNQSDGLLHPMEHLLLFLLKEYIFMSQMIGQVNLNVQTRDQSPLLFDYTVTEFRTN